MEISVSCSNAPFPFFFSQSNLKPTLRPMTDHWCKQFCQLFFSESSIFVSSNQRNIVLPCKLQIPKSKLLALFKPLWITFLHENSHFMVFQSFKTALTGRHIASIKWRVTRPKTHAIEACIFKYDVNKKKSPKKEPEPKPQLDASRPE